MKSKLFLLVWVEAATLCGCSSAELHSADEKAKKAGEGSKLKDDRGDEGKADDGGGDDAADGAGSDDASDGEGDGGITEDGSVTKTKAAGELGETGDAAGSEGAIDEGGEEAKTGDLGEEDETITKQRKACAIYYYRNLDRGCGPSRIVTWRVAIQDQMPTFADMKSGAVPALIEGTYGDSLYGGCKYQAMPDSHSHEGFDYKLWTDGSPGSQDCEAYTETVSPLIASFADESIRFTAPNKGPLFNLSGESVERFSWPMAGESHMFLVLADEDASKAMTIDDLFGNNTIGPDGKAASNGFAALAKHDENHDGLIDAKDAVFVRLRLWGDANQNGLADTGELVTLKTKNVRAINLAFITKPTRIDFFGNESREESVIELEGGREIRLKDYWLVSGETK